MEVVDVGSFVAAPQGAVVTIGAYDGVHLGHQAVLRLVREIADARGHEAVCLTFDRHPAEVVRPETAPKLLTALDQKLELLAVTGYLDRTCVCPFDEARSREPAEEFVRELLVETLGARVVIVGADFHFGYRRHGTVHLLEQMGAELGFEVLGLGLVPIDGDATGQPYSSTRIRALVANGRVREAARLYARPPRPHEVRGIAHAATPDHPDPGVTTLRITAPAQICIPAEGTYTGTTVTADGVERSATIRVGPHPSDGIDPVVAPRDRSARTELEVRVVAGGHALADLPGQQVAVRFLDQLTAADRSAEGPRLVG